MTSTHLRTLTQSEIDYVCNGHLDKLLGDKSSSLRKRLETIKIDKSVTLDEFKNRVQNQIVQSWIRNINKQLGF